MCQKQSAPEKSRANVSLNVIFNRSPKDKVVRRRYLRIHPDDNAAIALVDLTKGDKLDISSVQCALWSDVPAKHKFALRDFAPGDAAILYGILVGKAVAPIRKGELLSPGNTRHEASAFHPKMKEYQWKPPDVSRWQHRRFLGFARSDGQAATRNYWLVIPLVFCENRNVQVLKQAFEEELGFAPPPRYRREVAELVRLLREGKSDEIRTHTIADQVTDATRHSVFKNVDGIKFLLHNGGCGGTREDANSLSGLLAGYIHHPNVAGATVLSLGCQNAQVETLRREVEKRNPAFEKPLVILEQQRCGTELALLSAALRETFLGLIEADKATRTLMPLSRLTV
jgi:altronate hydrolase